MAELSAGDSGEDVCNEVKVFTPLPKDLKAGVGTQQHGGSVKSVGRSVGFGNTEEDCRVKNLGCRQRGRPTDPPFDHKTGKGYVKAKRGAYHDAQFVKKNKVNILLHESLGGGFSPPAAHKIRRLSRQAAAGTDRTPYNKAARRVSYKTYHTQRISCGIVKAEAETLLTGIRVVKGRACDRAGGDRAADPPPLARA